MKAIAEIEIQALGVGVSQREEVAEAIRLLEAAGLKTRTHSLGTEVSGPLEAVLLAVRDIHERLHESGLPRLTTRLQIETRTDHAVELEDAVVGVEGLLREPSEARARRAAVSHTAVKPAQGAGHRG